MKTINVILSAKEIYFLSELLKVEFLVGLKDPYKGFNENEIKKDWFQVKTALIERGILYERETYEINRKAAILINAMRPSSICCWFSLIEDGKQETSHYYFTPQMVVKSTRDLERNRYIIELAGTPKEILAEINERFSLSFKRAEGRELFSMPRHAFDQVLSGGNKENLSSNEFLRTIQTLKKSGQLELVLWNEQELRWDHEDFHFIEGENGGWITALELVDGKERVKILPTSSDEIKEHIKNMVLSRLVRDN